MPTAVITGCNSGIGHAFARILCDEGYKVYATDVNLGSNLKSLEHEKGAHISALDVTSSDSIASFKKETIGDQPVDIILNIAGVMSPKEDDSLSNVTPTVLTHTFQANTYGPLLLTQSLLPNLLRSPHPKIANMSSRVGSVADNSSGGSYAYRASKAALNSISKSMAMDLKERGVVVVIMHPGYVKSGLDTSGATLVNPEAVEPEEAAGKLWKVVQGKGMDESGKFWHREGYELPW